MPQLIRTPEQIFREEAKDLYFIEFAGPDGKIEPFGGGFALPIRRRRGKNAHDPEDPPGRAELLAWFANHLPHTRLEPLAPSERSGFLCGGINGRLRVDFDEPALQTYVARWETPEGESTDPRFACYHMPYAKWKDRLEASPEQE